jgi:hypothetical protein
MSANKGVESPPTPGNESEKARSAIAMALLIAAQSQHYAGPLQDERGSSDRSTAPCDC